MPRNQITKTIDWDNVSGILSLTFANGTERTFDAFALPKDIQHDLMLHGLNQKLIDRCAGSATKGGTDPIAWSISQCDEGYARLANGDWNAKRGTSEGPSSGITVRALARLRGYSEGEALAKWAALGKTDEGKAKRKAMAAHPDVRAMVAKIRFEEAEAAKAAAPAAPAATADLSAF